MLSHFRSMKSCLPNSHPSMTSAFRDGEQHNLMISWWSDWSILWPVISKVMNQHSPTAIDNRLSHEPVWVVRGSDQLDVRLIFVKIRSITSPFVKPRLHILDHLAVKLQDDTDYQQVKWNILIRNIFYNMNFLLFTPRQNLRWASSIYMTIKAWFFAPKHRKPLSEFIFP